MSDASSNSSGAKAAGSPRRRDWIVAAGAAVAIAVTVAFGFGGRLAGTSVDLLFWLRHTLAPVSHDPAKSAAVVVAIDEETYRTPPFVNLPQALWTHEIAAVLNALVAADVKVVGFDVIFPTSIDGLVPGFDRNFLVALHNAARAGKVVLGEVQHQEFPIHPFQAQSFAVGNARNVRSTNLFNDRDEIIRRVPLNFERENLGEQNLRREPAMAFELAIRAAGAAPTTLADGGIVLAGRRVPGSARNEMMLNFADGDAIPTYSLADLQACATQGNAAFFREHFAGKVVLLGAVLDVEDRKLTSMRFITHPDRPSTGPRCVHPPMTKLFRADLVRNTIPGVLVHATAVNNFLRGDGLRNVGALVVFGCVLTLALFAAAATMRLSPLGAGAAFAASGIAWLAVATLAFRANLVLPLLAPPLAGGLTVVALLGYRFAVTDRDKRLLRNSFSFYLPPAVVDRMLESDRLPQLGGEQRIVTVLFSDVAGFSSLSERLSPTELVALMNEYLTAMTDIVESEGGFIDKYIGDAIVAVFGAPLDNPHHALNAARAALRCRDRLEELNRDSAAFRGLRLQARIGINTGEALVGNIGSTRRFNYTAMGDTVNLAARLEGANKVYGTPIMVSAATRDAAGDEVAWRELDRIRVLGRDRPVTIFEPLALAAEMTEAQSRRARDFAAAIGEYRAGRFEAAAAAFDKLAATDGAACTFVARARNFLHTPPSEPWDAVTNLEQK